MKTRLPHLPSFISVCTRCRLQTFLAPGSVRFFSSTPRTLADSDPKPTETPKVPSTFAALSQSFPTTRQDQKLTSRAAPRSPSATAPPRTPSSTETSDVDDLNSLIPYPPSPSLSAPAAIRPPVPHHLHIYAHAHNTHITLTTPQRQPLLSVSCGNLHFRKAQRGTYDAAYQLGKYVMERITQQGLLKQIEYLEVILRDFGPGREALTKVLLGSEGRLLRGRVVRVADATRLKFGGTRSKKPRRLG